MVWERVSMTPFSFFVTSQLPFLEVTSLAQFVNMVPNVEVLRAKVLVPAGVETQKFELRG